ncbi:hypothetical protein ACFQ9J_28445 [Streptomyces sp. NPDC056529]|uniref:hypothetical protein n=1 Tax=Streptomyces sp. NPDC056529 TaxID=3345855 RepID=UPI00368AA195
MAHRPFGPSLEDLRQAGAEAHAARLLAQIDEYLESSWQGRLAKRLVRLWTWVKGLGIGR